MHKVAKKKLLVSILVVNFIIAILFGCGMILQNTLFNDHSNHQMANMECCDLAASQAINHNLNNIAYILPTTNLSALVLLLIISLAIVVFGQLPSLNKFTNYIRAIKDKYGGFKLFYYFIKLFSQGLLHPKIF